MKSLQNNKKSQPAVSHWFQQENRTQFSRKGKEVMKTCLRHGQAKDCDRFQGKEERRVLCGNDPEVNTDIGSFFPLFNESWFSISSMWGTTGSDKGKEPALQDSVGKGKVGWQPAIQQHGASVGYFQGTSTGG